MPNAELSDLPCGHCGNKGALLQCGRCRATAYCNYQCQKAAWKDHKPICGVKKAVAQAPTPLSKEKVDIANGGYAPKKKPAPELRAPKPDPPNYKEPPKMKDTLNYNKWANIGDSSDEEKVSLEPQKPKVSEHAERMLKTMQEEVDRIAGIMARTGKGLDGPVSGGVARDLHVVVQALNKDILPDMPNEPIALWLQGIANFLLRKTTTDEKETRWHTDLAKQSLELAMKNGNELSVDHQLHALDFLSKMYVEENRNHDAYVAAEKASGLKASAERYMLIGRSRAAEARAEDDIEERNRGLRIAKSNLNNALDVNPDLSAAYQELEQIFKDLDDISGARESAKRCICRGIFWERYLQRPLHYIQGINSQPWWETSKLDVCRHLEAAYAFIKMELLELLSPPGTQQPPSSPDSGRDWGRVGMRAFHDAELITAGEWREFVFFGDSNKCQEHQQRCPRTTAALNAIPEIRELADYKIGETLFSLLAPGTELKRHCGPTNMRLTCHLGLVVPEEGCTITVGTDAPRAWEEGKCIVFDDSFEHTVKNESKQNRIVLLVNFWHPDIPRSEWPEKAKVVHGWSS